MLQKKLNEIGKRYKEYNASKPTPTQKAKYLQAQGEALAEVAAMISANSQVVIEKVETPAPKKTTTKSGTTAKKTTAKKTTVAKEPIKKEEPIKEPVKKTAKKTTAVKEPEKKEEVKEPAKKTTSKRTSTKKAYTKSKAKEKIVEADPNVNPMALEPVEKEVKVISCEEALRSDLTAAGLTPDSLGFKALMEASKIPKSVSYNAALKIMADNLGSLPHVLSSALNAATAKCKFIKTDYLQELARINPTALTKEKVVYFIQNFGEMAKDGIEI